jgi:hypothetical protein
MRWRNGADVVPGLSVFAADVVPTWCRVDVVSTLYQWCGVDVVSMVRCRCGVDRVRCLFGHGAVSMRCRCGVDVVSTWCKMVYTFFVGSLFWGFVGGPKCTEKWPEPDRRKMWALCDDLLLLGPEIRAGDLGRWAGCAGVFFSCQYARVWGELFCVVFNQKAR